MSPTLPSVTVAVPVKDRREEMVGCLDAILAQDYPDYDVLVLDNGSSDGTPDAVRERAAGSRVPVRVESVAGSVGRVRNLAAELAEGEVVAYTDSDCRPAAHWLGAGVAPFSRPEVGLVQGMTLPDPDGAQVGWHYTTDIREFTGRFETCNLFVRREALVASEGFDEGGFGWEDTAGGYALMRQGWKADFAADALVHHAVRHPPYGWWLRRGETLGHGARVVRRYPEIRREVLWLGVFNQKRTARLLAAIVGLALARRMPLALLLALPYARERAPRSLPSTGHGVVLCVQPILYDLATLAGMAKGSLRARTLVL